MQKHSSRKRRYGRWICKRDGYEARDVRDREKHYREKHPDVHFDRRFMARHWDYPDGAKPRRAKTMCTKCGREIPVGERSIHLKDEHPEVEPDYGEVFDYPK